MELLLTTDIAGLGMTGDIVDVKAGYGRNYLLPRGLAKPVSEHAERELATLCAKRERDRKELMVGLETIKKKIEGLSLTLVEKASDEGHLFGSVGVRTVVDAFAEAGVEVAEKSIDPDLHIKELGIYDVPINLGQSVVANVKVWVVEEV